MYWKCRFDMAVMHLILQETPWKISMQNFHFWVQDQKLWNGPPCFWHLLEILEILLLHVLSNDACQFATNLFPISWEPFDNVNLIFFFVLEMQIWHGCNALNIAGNPMKDINAKLSFLSSGSNVVAWTPAVLTSVRNLGNSTFACTVQWSMQICYKPFAHQLRAIWKC